MSSVRLLSVSIFVFIVVSGPTASAAPAGTDKACMDLITTGQSALGRGDIKLANTCFVQALVEAEKLGKDDRHVAYALNDLALSTVTNPDKAVQKKDKLSQAITYQRRAIAIEEKVYGPESDNVAFDLQNLGVWLGLNQQLKEGETALTRSATIREKLFGKNSDQLAMTLGSLASNLSRQKRYIEATAQLKRAEQIYKLGNHPLERSRVLYELSVIYQAQGNFKEAGLVLAEALPLREKVYGKDSLVTAETLHSLAVCDIKQGENGRALESLKRAMEIVKKGHDPEITAVVNKTYLTCLAALAKKNGH